MTSNADADTKFPCNELGCTGTLIASEPNNTTRSDQLTAICNKCENEKQVQCCERCGSTSFDHAETIITPGWVTGEGFHVKDESRKDYAETSYIACENCGSLIK